MTALIARQPLQQLLMSSIQRGSRRLSVRLQEKDDGEASTSRATSEWKNTKSSTNGCDSQILPNNAAAKTKKRKINYDEEDDGFAFTRVKKRKPRISDVKEAQPSQQSVTKPPVPALAESGSKPASTNGETSELAKKRRTKMSFSTPDPKEATVRRSKRLSNEGQVQRQSPQHRSRRKEEPVIVPQKVREVNVQISPKKQRNAIFLNGKSDATTQLDQEEQQSQNLTKIALPFADTPVIRRNKAMREGKTGKSERRSSMSLRGRRASSLIESGNSNALPHSEVAISDFYKHIESDGLPEPRRMRLLLTWCATRALDQKPIGTDFEDASARSAARVIQEELLKDLSNRSELSDWFSREDEPIQKDPLPERPHPKNVQNAEKITELEEQIKRLRSERDALEKLLRPPDTLQPNQMQDEDTNGHQVVDKSLLSETDAAILDSLDAAPNLISDTSIRMKAICESIGPTIDAFTDGVFAMGSYCDAADAVAVRVLAMCSEKLTEREREGRKRALPAGDDHTPRRDLMGVLKGLSRVDR